MATLNHCQILLALSPIFLLTQGKVVRHTFSVNYMSGGPDGVLVHHILAINDQFPGPAIHAEVNDILEITLINNIRDRQNVTLHWHGIHQRGTPFEDGPSLVTQCPLMFNRSQVYRFPVPQAGTYWYHSHVNSQYTEGLWGVLIVHAKPEVHQHLYKEDIIITLNDWYHTSGHENDEFLLSTRSGGAPPYPSAVLMNGMGRYPCNYSQPQNRVCSTRLQNRPWYRVRPGETYRLRLINTGGWMSFNFTVEGHTLRTIEVDGIDTVVGEPVQAVHIAPGQRYSFLLSIPENGVIGRRFLMRANARLEFLFRRPVNINPYQDAIMPEATGVIQYTSTEFFASTERFEDFRSDTGHQVNTPWTTLRFLDEVSLVPYDGQRPPSIFNRNLELRIGFTADANGIIRGSFNHRPAKLPYGRPILAKFLRGEPIDHSLYPEHIRWKEVVQVVVNNPERGAHPIHLHGHHFWVMGMGKQDDGDYDPNRHQLSYSGMRRDTVMVKQYSWLVIRFYADNVGVWTLHCHIDWHMLTGMMMTFIEGAELMHTIRIPEEARRVCADHNIII